MNRERIASSLIVALAGLFYIFAPHELHVAIQADFGFSHGVHVIMGAALIGMSIYYVRMKPEKKKKSRARRRPRKRARRARRARAARKMPANARRRRRKKL